MSRDNQPTSEKDGLLMLAQHHLEKLGIKDVLLFDHSQVLRIQVPEADFDRALQMRDTIADQLKAVGYRFIALDLEQKDD